MAFWQKNLKIKKYLQTFKLSWQDAFVYRLNFFMWRLRTVVMRLGAYFFWYAVYRFNKQIGPYDEQMMITYILAGSMLNTLIFSTRAHAVSDHIANGALNNYLVKPMNYFKQIFAVDLADKASNFFFFVAEMVLFFIIFKPLFFIQTNIFYLIAFTLVVFLGILIYFYLNMVLSLVAFWHPEDSGWSSRFLFMMFNRFFSGRMIPLDILPAIFYQILRFLPSAYLIYFPLQVYLGRVSGPEVFQGVAVMVFWILALRFLLNKTWKKGLKIYTAVGI